MYGAPPPMYYGAPVYAAPAPVIIEQVAPAPVIIEERVGYGGGMGMGMGLGMGGAFVGGMLLGEALDRRRW